MNIAGLPSTRLAQEGTVAAARTLRLAEALLANRAVGWLQALGGAAQPAAQPLEKLIWQCLDAAANAGPVGAGDAPRGVDGRARRGEGRAPWPEPVLPRAPIPPLPAHETGRRPALPAGAGFASTAAPLAPLPVPATGLAAVRPGAAVSANEANAPDAAPRPMPRPAPDAVRPRPSLTSPVVPAVDATGAAPPNRDGAAAAAGFALRRQANQSHARLAVQAQYPRLVAEAQYPRLVAEAQYPMPGISGSLPPAAAGSGPGFGAASAAAAHIGPPSQAVGWPGQGAQPAGSGSVGHSANAITAIELPPQPTRLVSGLTALQGLLQSAVADSRQRHALPALPALKAGAEPAANPGAQLDASLGPRGSVPAGTTATPGAALPALDALAEEMLVDRLADRLQDRLRELALRHLGFTGGVV